MTSRSVAHTLALASVLWLAPHAGQAQTAPKEPPPLWDVQVGMSFVGTSGNSSTSSAGADFAMHRRGEVWQLESTATAVRASTDGATTAERYLGQGRAKRDLSAVTGITAGVKLERDPFSGIDFRSVLDAGLSWHLVRSPAWQLDAVTAFAWDHDRATIGNDVDDAGGVLQLSSRVAFGAAGDTTERVTFYPDFRHSGASRSEGEASVEAAMNAHLALKIGYLLRYSNAPVAGFKKTDNTSTASIVLRWKASTPAPR